MNSAVEHHKSKITPRRQLRTWSLCGLALAVTLTAGLASAIFHWHERAWFYVASSLDAGHWAGHSIWLPDYHVEIEARPVAGVADDLSAIDFDPDNQRLLAVTNASPIKLVALDREGRVKAEYPLVGFQDVEGLAYMGDGQVAVSEENAQQLLFFHLPDRPGQAIDKKDAQSLTLGINLSTHNKGFEGVTYDAAHDRLFVAKEREPRQLYAISGIKASLGGNLRIKVQDLTYWVEHSVFAKDISDLHYDARTGHLLVLSDESRLVIELGEKGEVVSFRTLLGHLGDLKKSAGQAEGLTLDDQGRLYVVSEPNLFYRFRKD